MPPAHRGGTFFLAFRPDRCKSTNGFGCRVGAPRQGYLGTSTLVRQFAMRYFMILTVPRDLATWLFVRARADT